MANWAKLPHASAASNTEGWGYAEWGNSVWGGEATDSWIKQGKITDTWTKVEKAA